MSEQAKNATCLAIRGEKVESMKWSPADKHGDGYWVLTFTDRSELCFNRLMAELV